MLVVATVGELAPLVTMARFAVTLNLRHNKNVRVCVSHIFVMLRALKRAPRT